MMSEWIDSTIAVPTTATRVLIFSNYYGYPKIMTAMYIRRKSKGKDYWRANDILIKWDIEKVSYWMQLPNIPKESKL